MSRSLHAYLDPARLPDRAALQAAVKAFGFRLQVDEAWAPFASPDYLPCTQGVCAAEIQARVDPGRGARQGAARRPGSPPGQAVQRRIAPLPGPTLRAGAICGATRRCRLVVGADPTPRRRLDWPRNSPRRGPGFLPRRLLEGEDAGVYLRFARDAALPAAASALQADQGARSAEVQLRWGGDLREQMAATILAGALAQGFDALVVAPDTGAALTAATLSAKARAMYDEAF